MLSNILNKIVLKPIDVPSDLFLNGFSVGLSKQVEKSAAEVVSVAVGVAQLIGDGVQEQVAAYNAHQNIVKKHFY